MIEPSDIAERIDGAPANWGASARSHMVADYDGDGRLLPASAVFLQLMGHTLAEATGWAHATFCHGAHADAPAEVATLGRAATERAGRCCGRGPAAALGIVLADETL